MEEMKTSNCPSFKGAVFPFAAAGAVTCLIDQGRAMVGSLAAVPLLCQHLP